MKRIALFLGVVFALGCGGGGVSFVNSPIVRMVSAYSGKTVNGDVGGNSILANGTFASAGVKRIDKGTYDVRFLEAGTALVNQSQLFEDGNDYSIIGYNGGLFILQEQHTPAAGNAAIRIANAAGALQPSLDIYTGDQGSTFATATLYRDNLDQGTFMGFQDFPAGAKKFFVTDATGTTVLYEGDQNFMDGKHYTIILGANGTLHFITLTED